MGARSFDELDAWKLASDLKRRIYVLAGHNAVARDRWFSDQLRRAAASAPANIAEGFGRFEPAEFRRFLRIANGSLVEVTNHLRDGVDRQLFTAEDVVELFTLARRASAATSALMKYLEQKTRRPR